MEPALQRLVEYVPPIRKALPLPAVALASVVSRDGNSVYASADTLFKGAVFGRDSLEVADDLMTFKPALVHNILLTMGVLQGVSHDNQREEQPGKIIHEYRQSSLDGKPIDSASLEIFKQLGRKWGGTDTELAYYGSVDATPHFLRTVGQYCKLYGQTILQEKITQRSGETVDMHHVVRAAITWMIGQLAASKSGLLEYKKLNPHGISNQVWKDSEEFYVHESGEMANHNLPIASIEVQGLAYDALLAAAQLVPDKADRYTAVANKLRDETLNRLWQPDRNYFALGLDYGPDAQPRLINTPTANPAALLDTAMFDQLPAAERQLYVSAIIKRIMDKDFLTNAGIRSRSLLAAELVPFWDYHGSYVTWPKETYDIAKGLQRHGFTKLSRQLENRLLNIVLKTRQYPEFVYVNGAGTVLAGTPSPHTHANMVFVAGPNKPERLQAWTVSALMAIVSNRGLTKQKRRYYARPGSWQALLETQVMDDIPHVDLHINPIKLWLQYPTQKYQLTPKDPK